MDVLRFTLPVPPSDNRRLILLHDHLGNCRHQIGLSSEARRYLQEAMLLLKSQWPRGTILVPSRNHQLHITAKSFVKNWRGDCSNFTKLLKDVLTGTVYTDDKFVHINYEDSELDKKNPHIECSVPIDRFSVGSNQPDVLDEKVERLRPNHCTCAYPHLLFLGWPSSGITHHPHCPRHENT